MIKIAEKEIDKYNEQFPETITKKIIQLNLFDPAESDLKRLR